MKKAIFFFLLAISSISGFSQQSKQWKGYFSYNDIHALSESSSRIYATAENVLFSKGISANELQKITSVNDFKAETITAMRHSTAFRKTLVGNQNGLLLVVNDDGSVLNVIDIVNKPSIPPNRKKINDIYEYNGKAYLSC